MCKNYLIAIVVMLSLVLAIIILYLCIKYRKLIKKFIRKYKVIKFITDLVIPFAIPLALSFVLYDSTYENWQFVFVVSMCVVAAINIVAQFYSWQKERKEIDLKWENSASKESCNNLFEIFKNKNVQYRNIYHKNTTAGKLKKSIKLYNPFEQIRLITYNFCLTISKITDIPTKDMDASFIYRYTYRDASESDVSWRWVTGKGLNFKVDLNEFVENTDSAFRYMDKTDTPRLFYNDKNEAVDARQYQRNYKDHMYGLVGSFVAAKVVFSSNDDTLCEGIIMVNSYGKKFLDDSSEHTEEELKHLIMDKIFPCYEQLLISELSTLYFRHRPDKKEKSLKYKKHKKYRRIK